METIIRKSVTRIKKRRKAMKKKITAIIVTAGLAVCALAACGQKPAEQPAAPTTPASGSQSAAPVVAPSGSEVPGMLGGWEVNYDDTMGWTTAAAEAALEKAEEGLVGAEYKIVALLGTQVVAGTNYEILCEVTPVVPNATPSLAVVTVYEDLEGNAEITNVTDIDLGEYYGATNPEDEKAFAQIAGGWAIPEEVQAVNLPEPPATAFSKVMGEDKDIIPVAYLGSQTVSGSNYAILCFDKTSPCIVYIYAPLNADPELVSIYKINMGEMSGN